jgi:hypothetical protein
VVREGGHILQEVIVTYYIITTSHCSCIASLELPDDELEEEGAGRVFGGLAAVVGSLSGEQSQS